MITDKFKPGDRVKINNGGDLAFEGDKRPYIGKEGIVEKITRGGLYYVYFEFNNRREAFAPYNVDPANYCPMPPQPFDPTLWTVEATQDIQAQHGIDLEREMLERLMKEIGV